jgi:hypothetical protein
VGNLQAREDSYPYALSWWIAARKPVIGEVMPAPHPLAPPPPRGEATEIGLRMRGGAPAPMLELDPVASRLWQAELERSGMPFAIRCLATWWRIRPKVNPRFPDEAVAATVASAVARCAGVKRSSAESAAIYGADALLVALTSSALRSELQLDPGRGW